MVASFLFSGHIEIEILGSDDLLPLVEEHRVPMNADEDLPPR